MCTILLTMKYERYMTTEKDIVKVLRTMRPSIIPDLWTSILNEAADEIEKLRKENDKLKNWIALVTSS
jgi:hypothetical protein